MPKQSLQTIQSQIRKLQAKAEALKAKNKKPALQAIIKLMRENDISVGEITASMTRKSSTRAATAKQAGLGVRKNRSVAIKYRNPETDETWTGRGKTPRWLAEMEAAGRNRSEFAV